MTKKQAEVVQWLIEHGHELEPIQAVHAGLISTTTLYTKWGLEQLQEWIAEYKAAQPPPPMTQEEIQRRLQALIPASLDSLEETLRRGKGDRTAVTLAQWILREAHAAPPVVQQPKHMNPAEDELAQVIQFTKTGTK